MIKHTNLRGHAALLAGVIALAAPALFAAEDAREELQQFLSAANTYSARFEQILTDEQGTVVEETSGRFWLARPGRFRWLYEGPLERELVSDGERIWLYDVELEQVTVRAADETLMETPAGILVGEPGALDAYSITYRGADGSGTLIGLTPREGRGEFEDIVIEIDGPKLRSLTLFDRFGQRTRILFTDGQRNVPVDVDLFRFRVPDGADVIDQTG